MWRPLAVVVAVALVVGGIGVWRDEAPRLASTPIPAAASAPALADVLSRGTAAGEPGPGRRPRSLRGTRVDGELTVDAAGDLLVTDGTRRFFDYFLTASGEETPERLRARIIAAAERRVPAPAARELGDLLDRYLLYRERVRLLADTGADGDLRARLDLVSALRREVFGTEVASTLFGDEEAAARLVLTERELTVDPTLSAEDRAARLAAVEADVPAELRASRAAAMTAIALRREEAALRDRGAPADELQALREQMVGADAAARLADLDRRRAEWTARVDAYRAARAAIEGDATLDAAARTAALDALLAERFDTTEALRLRALDAIARGDAAP